MQGKGREGERLRGQQGGKTGPLEAGTHAQVRTKPTGLRFLPIPLPV